MRRPLLAFLCLLTLAGLTACGDDAGEATAGDGGGEVRTAPLTFGDGTEVWLRVETGGGFVPYIVNLRQTPSLLLFDDGRLVRLVTDDEGLPGVVPQFEQVQLDEAATADLLDTFAAVVDGPDPGTPGVTDNPTTTIEVTTDGETQDLGIYAPGFEDGLTDSELATRHAAQDAVDETYGLAGAEPFGPDEWLVLTSALPGDTGATAAPVPWPLAEDRRATAAEPAVCTRVTGEDRDAVLDALADSGFDVLVGTGDDLAEVALRPVLTGEETCNLSGSDQFVER